MFYLRKWQYEYKKEEKPSLENKHGYNIRANTAAVNIKTSLDFMEQDQSHTMLSNTASTLMLGICRAPKPRIECLTWKQGE